MWRTAITSARAVSRFGNLGRGSSKPTREGWIDEEIRPAGLRKAAVPEPEVNEHVRVTTPDEVDGVKRERSITPRGRAGSFTFGATSSSLPPPRESGPFSFWAAGSCYAFRGASPCYPWAVAAPFTSQWAGFPTPRRASYPTPWGAARRREKRLGRTVSGRGARVKYQSRGRRGGAVGGAQDTWVIRHGGRTTTSPTTSVDRYVETLTPETVRCFFL